MCGIRIEVLYQDPAIIYQYPAIISLVISLCNSYFCGCVVVVLPYGQSRWSIGELDC